MLYSALLPVFFLNLPLFQEKTSAASGKKFHYLEKVITKLVKTYHKDMFVRKILFDLP